MRLIECYIENFGTLCRHRLSFNDTLNSFVHENGYGKTTLTVFIRAMLYGLSDTKKTDLYENDRRHYLPWNMGVCGGWLSFSVGKKDYRVERTFAQKAQDDTFKLYDIKTGKESSDFTKNLGQELFGIDKDGFERTVFLSERNLSGKNENKSISEKLSDTTGAEYDVGAMDAALKILEERRRFYYKRGGGGEISATEAKLFSAERELSAILGAREEYSALCRELEALEKEKDELEEKRRSAELSLVSLGKRQEAKARKEHYERIMAERSRMLLRLNELDSFFASGVPTREEIEIAYRSSLTAESPINVHLEPSAELVALKDKLSHVTKTELEEAKASLNGKSSTLSTAGYIASVAIFVAAIALFFINTVPAFITLLIGIFVMVLTTLLDKNIKKSAKNAKIIFDKLSITDRKKAKETIDALIGEHVKLELLEEEERSKHTQLSGLRSMISEAKTESEKFLSRFPTKSTYPYDEIRAAFTERETLIRQLAELPEAPSTEYDAPTDDVTENPSIRLSEINARNAEVTSDIRSRRERLLVLERTLETEDEIRSLITERKETLETYRKNLSYLQKAKDFLEAAKDNLTAKYLEKTKSAFTKYMALIDKSDGEYMLNTSFEITKSEYGSAKASENYSLGTRNIHYLATRLALIDALFENEKPFLIFDDPFMSLDDRHLPAALEILKRLSETYQVIYFTCSRSRDV